MDLLKVIFLYVLGRSCYLYVILFNRSLRSSAKTYIKVVTTCTTWFLKPSNSNFAHKVSIFMDSVWFVEQNSEYFFEQQ